VTSKAIELIRRADNVAVEGELMSGLTGKEVDLIERGWIQERGQLLQALLHFSIPRADWPQTLHWDWTKKAPELKLLESTGYGIVVSQQWQGAMLTKTASRAAQLEPDNGKPLVYVDYVESAPWNWPVAALGFDGEYKGVGAVLITEAVLQSFDEGFGGRVGLHAVPQAEEFYEGCGMTPLARDPAKENLRYFEFSRNAARKFLT
jgi:hypothetical protein